MGTLTLLNDNPRLDAWLAEALGAREAHVRAAERLSGGAIQENWGLDVIADGESHALVLRRNAPAAVAASRALGDEHAILVEAWEAGVVAPRPVAFCADRTVIGAPFALVERKPGLGYGPKIVRDARLGGDRTALGRELGRQLARIHAIKPSATLTRMLGPKPEDPARVQIAELRDWLDQSGTPRPALEWGLRWAERNTPPPAEIVLAHRDYRTGNFLVDETGLTAILDWEFAAWSDPADDIGWFCAECWRFSRPDLEAGGICRREAFYEGYEAESGRRIDPDRVRWWEVVAHLRWAVIALQQGGRHASGAERSLNLALTGRMADGLELAALRMTQPMEARS